MSLLLALICGLAIGLLIGLWMEQRQKKNLQTELLTARQEAVRQQALAESARSQAAHDAQMLKDSFATERSSLNQTIATLQTALKQNEEDMRTKSEAMKVEFQNLANSILEAKSEALRTGNKEQLEATLNPLKENIQQLGKAVTDGRVSSAQYKEAMEHAIKGLMEKTDKIGEDAVNLAKALRANPKIQGDWGEMILERMLEESGLRKGEEYFVQENCVTEDGRNVRPDVIVRFPEGRSLIIDSKVSLTAYVDYINATDAMEQNQAWQMHVASMRSHVNELAEKDYSKVVKDSIGYVLMFVPNEGSYIAAVEKDKDLLNYAYKKGIIVISPSNLMMALQLAYNLWQSEKQSRNVEEIIKRGNLLYEKFVTFVSGFEKMGKQLDDTRRQYDLAMGTLVKGKGNIITSLDKMRQLGLTPKKEMPSSIMDRTESLPE